MQNDALAMILVVVGIVLLLAVNSPSMLVLFLVKIVGFLFVVSGSFMMGEKEND